MIYTSSHAVSPSWEERKNNNKTTITTGHCVWGHRRLPVMRNAIALWGKYDASVKLLRAINTNKSEREIRSLNLLITLRANFNLSATRKLLNLFRLPYKNWPEHEPRKKLHQSRQQKLTFYQNDAIFVADNLCFEHINAKLQQQHELLKIDTAENIWQWICNKFRFSNSMQKYTDSVEINTFQAQQRSYIRKTL